MTTDLPTSVDVARIIDAALVEDLASAGDITSNAIFSPHHTTTATVVARSAGTIAGLALAGHVFDRVAPATVAVSLHARDGDTVEAGTALATLQGITRTVLTGERVFLNLLGHLSGVATSTRELVDVVADHHTRVADTRKTTPGLRTLEKYAVRCGGGTNHRFGLYDAAMIKDNHLAAAGSITEAVGRVRAATGHTVSIVVEVDHLHQIDEAIAAGADVLLLDNMRGDVLAEAVQKVDGRVTTEASGGIDKSTANEIAAAGVDVISVGWITHSAPRLDVALDM